jgi:fatty acid desaturase
MRGAFQTFGFLGMLGAWFALAVYFHAAGGPLSPLLCVGACALYGLQANFLINGMHELGHQHVFKTRWVNGAAMRVISFLGWLHPDMIFSSHLRHHRYTQNFPHDQENPMPMQLTWRHFVSFGFVNIAGAKAVMGETLKVRILTLILSLTLSVTRTLTGETLKVRISVLALQSSSIRPDSQCLQRPQYVLSVYGYVAVDYIVNS